MKKETLQKIKKGSLDVLSVVLMGLVLLPMFVFVTDILAVVFSVINAPFLSIVAAAGLYALGSFGAYKISEKVFNYLKDEIIIGQKSAKRRADNLCEIIDGVKKLENVSLEDISKVEKLIEKTKPIEKIDESINLLSSMQRGNGLGFLFVKEGEVEIIKTVVDLQRRKEECIKKVQEFEEIKKNQAETMVHNEVSDLEGTNSGKDDVGELFDNANITKENLNKENEQSKQMNS